MPSEPKRPPLLSKSTYLMGLQCPKLLWHRYNAKDEFPETGEATQAIFDQGHEIGALARKRYPIGIEVAEGIVEFDQVIRQTQEVLPLRRPLFEAAFKTEFAYARVDILVPVNQNAWDIVEVKSSTEAKDIHEHDLAFQKHVCTSAGLKIRNCVLLLVDNTYVRHGEVDPKKLFTKVDLSGPVDALLPTVPTKVAEMLAVIRQPRFPEVRIGKQCHDPYTCALVEKCWAFLPENNVLDLYRAGPKGFTLLNQGVAKISDIPDGVSLTDRQTIQLKTARSGRPHIDRPAIQSFLAKLKFPLAFLDFETFSTAIPLFDDVKPYQQVPFQFSLHVVESPGTEPVHHKFLSTDRRDPRGEFMRQLKAVLPRKGSVIVFNASFEKSRMRECCELLPEYESWWSRAAVRVVDLLDPFRSFDYYHPDQAGSASIKDVMPALTGKGYEGLEIQDGGAASREFLRVTFGDVAVEERERVCKALDDYCDTDTRGMIEIVSALESVIQDRK